jgi:cytidine deaminase
MPERELIEAATARRLMEAAIAARGRAYAPYSHFSVGAAALAENGTVFTGCNVENAVFGLTLCAERIALFKAVSEGISDFEAIAVVGPDDDAACPPCGSCRQVMAEFAPDLVVLTPDGEGGIAQRLLRELLPGAFDASWLPQGGEP